MSPGGWLVLMALQIGMPTGGLRGRVRAASLEAAGAVVFLVAEGADSAPASMDTVLIDQREIGFLPRVSPVRFGTTVLFRNSDPILHNVFSPPGPGAGFNLGTYPSPGVRGHRFAEPGVYAILCHVHPEMVAYVLVLATSLWTVVDRDGTFSLSDLPAGRYRLRVWQERTAPLEQEIQILAGRTTGVDLELVPARHRRR